MTAWDGIKNAAKAPVKFVVETVVNKALIGNFNKVAKKLGTSTLPVCVVAVWVCSWWCSVRAMSSMRDGDDQLVPMRRGEGVLVSEGLRTARDRAAFLAANAAGRRGVGFASLMQGGFAGGGILGVRRAQGWSRALKRLQARRRILLVMLSIRCSMVSILLQRH